MEPLLLVEWMSYSLWLTGVWQERGCKTWVRKLPDDMLFTLGIVPWITREMTEIRIEARGTP